MDTGAALSLASVLVLSSGCILGPPPAPHATVPAPEETGLVERLSGYLILPARLEDRGLSAIRVVALPSMDEHVIRPTMPGGTRYIHALSGPDREGRIAFIQSAPGEPYLVKTVRVDGSGEREIVQVQETAPGGKHEWLDPGIGDQVSISPVRGRIAFVRDLLGRQMPGAYTTVGTLEVRDIETLDTACKQGGAVDWGISWFPDGRRVAYVEFVRRDRVPMPDEDDTFGKSGDQNFQGWDDVPAVVQLNVETLDTKVIGLGIDPVVSAAGDEVFVRDPSGDLRVIHLATGKYSKIEVSGLRGAVLACLRGKSVIYRSRLTEGQAVERSPYGSFRAGIQLLPLKVCNLSTGEFQTIIEGTDPRHQVSYGSKE